MRQSRSNGLYSLTEANAHDTRRNGLEREEQRCKTDLRRVVFVPDHNSCLPFDSLQCAKLYAIAKKTGVAWVRMQEIN